MAVNVSILVLAMIAAGMIIMFYQRRKYFYLGTFFARRGMTSTVIDLKNSGRYVINVTSVGDNPKTPASFKIEEGSFQKNAAVIDLSPDKLSTFTYPNSQALVANRWISHQESKPAAHQIKLQDRDMLLSGEKLRPIDQGKVVTAKRFMQQKKAKSSQK